MEGRRAQARRPSRGSSGRPWATGSPGSRPTSTRPRPRAATPGRWPRQKLASGDYDLLILDELTYAVTYGWVPVDDVVAGIRDRAPQDQRGDHGTRRRPRARRDRRHRHRDAQDQARLRPGDQGEEGNRVLNPFRASGRASGRATDPLARSPSLGPRLVIAGTHSGVGKTTVATGLMAALRAQRHGRRLGQGRPRLHRSRLPLARHGTARTESRRLDLRRERHGSPGRESRRRVLSFLSSKGSWGSSTGCPTRPRSSRPIR